MPGQLKFGLTSINGGTTSYPEALVRIAQAAETAGFDSLWAGEHHVLATSSSRIPATSRFLNPVVALTFVAAHTHHPPGNRHSAAAAAPAAHPGEGTGQPGCALRRPVDCGDWRRLGRGRVRGAGRALPRTRRSHG